ncbi:phosphoribosylamine--glycine ligase [Methyloversatilis sp.]|uniref:phosphoribosylamine--glycine ligase n=1 Tax=Methyloversatilis sp. TaxID=2569862 RepID=UPI0027329BB7|nr:phosphoribosylamine--glycine ligase [Methyloversatilis sp.]MDP2870578.1 phosphoribosylamine--glycine ligase [Methyloversatilis sp.]MDP3457565.1 phosphoribosylamine--glycine ligase [Methyloversatilis sp.]MDP3578429.1 phosphoribosylamine--glycine ligase [Methyloversatilis sp.]
MKLLVIGSGGREHAIAWKLSQSPRVQKVYVAPGNAGTALEPGLENLPITDFTELINFVEGENIAFTVVGPEAALAAGVVDCFRVRGLKIFGPTRKAAQLESSKDFAKQFMVRSNIPTARHETFTDAAAAHAYVDEMGAPIVIKADGLAAGKGVVVAMTLTEAHGAIGMMLADNESGRSRVVIEEFLQGEEASFIAMCDGVTALPLATSQDHKRLLDGDAGPNTGGMGAYSPAPVVTPEIHARVMREVIQPVLTGMALDGLPFTGFLYAGLMISPEGDVKVLEFNCRMGDPETQPIMMRLKTDLVDLMEAALENRLSEAHTDWDRRVALGVVMASAGYPDTPRKGDPISGLPPDTAENHVFHAGTAAQDGEVVTAGGRVLCVTALGDTVKQAQRAAYLLCDKVQFAGMQFRRDIGYRAARR